MPSGIPGTTRKSRFHTSGIVLILVALLIASPVLTGHSQAAHPAETKIGLITDLDGLDEGGWSWLSYQGLLRAQSEFGVVSTVYVSTQTSDFASNLQRCATGGNALCITVGFSTADAITNAAKAYPTTKFAILDFEFSDYPPNLRGIAFAVNGAAYLAGILAGSMSQTRTVGAIGAMEIPAVTAFTLPFQNGARCASPGATTLLTYTNDFGNPALGAQVAQSLMAQGADVIFSPAGHTSVGATLAAAQSGRWAIGVDTDFYDTVFDGGAVAGSEKLLTSVIKKLDTATYLTVRDVVLDAFTPGTIWYGLIEDGVGLAPYHEAEAAIPQHVKAYVEQVRQDVLAGKVDFNSPACSHYRYLPFVAR